MDLKAWESLENAAITFSNRYIERVMDLKAWESLENAAITLFSNRYIERIMDLKAWESLENAVMTFSNRDALSASWIWSLRELRKCSYNLVLQQIYWSRHEFESFERT